MTGAASVCTFFAAQGSTQCLVSQVTHCIPRPCSDMHVAVVPGTNKQSVCHGFSQPGILWFQLPLLLCHEAVHLECTSHRLDVPTAAGPGNLVCLDICFGSYNLHITSGQLSRTSTSGSRQNSSCMLATACSLSALAVSVQADQSPAW